MDAHQERMEALLDISLETMEACLENTEVDRGKVGTKMEACLEDAAVKTLGAFKGRSRDRRLAVRCRGRQDDGVSRKKLAAVRGRMTHRALSA
jgi:hypothetical protein